MSEAETPAVEGEVAPKKGRKKLLIMIAAGLLLLGGGGAGGAYFLGFLGGSAEGGEEAAHVEPAVAEFEAPSFHELPEMVVRLEGGQGPYLKLVATLDLASAEYGEPIKSIEPRLIDLLQTYLMELSPDDIKNAAGLHHVREELLKRVNDLMPHSTNAVLFKTIILQ
jgi:flagellar protein FliL